MLNRRQFVASAAATAATFGRARRSVAAQAPKYDLIIRGGRVIDPSVRHDAIPDLAISGGRIFLRSDRTLRLLRAQPRVARIDAEMKFPSP